MKPKKVYRTPTSCAGSPATTRKHEYNDVQRSHKKSQRTHKTTFNTVFWSSCVTATAGQQSHGINHPKHPLTHIHLEKSILEYTWVWYKPNKTRETIFDQNYRSTLGFEHIMQHNGVIEFSCPPSIESVVHNVHTMIQQIWFLYNVI